ILTSTFSPAIGGAESYALMLANGLEQRGHRPVVITDGLASFPIEGRSASPARGGAGVSIPRARRGAVRRPHRRERQGTLGANVLWPGERHRSSAARHADRRSAREQPGV